MNFPGKGILKVLNVCKCYYSSFTKAKFNKNLVILTTQSFSTDSENIPFIDKSEYDVVISGGGLVGFAAGCALGKSPYFSDRRILILERQSNRLWQLPEEYSNRVFSLNHGTHNLFKSLGVWDHVEKYRAQPVKKMQVWESCSDALIQFDNQHSEEVLAHIVENDVLIESLKQQIPQNVEVCYDSRISTYELPSTFAEKVKINFHDGSNVSTDLLIGADGAKSLVRDQMGCNYLSWDYDQMGIVATLELHDEIENFVAWQKFLPSGPIAFLPLSSKRMSLVWSTTKTKARELLSLGDVEFTDALNNALWNDAPTNSTVESLYSQFSSLLQTFNSSCSSVGGKQLPPSISGVIPKSRAAFPLGLGHSTHYVAPRVALIGDAAHRVHPLAGQGVNLGFGDVSSLVKCLEESMILGENLGAENALHSYETDRQRHNVPSLMAIDGLHRLYTTSFPPIVLLRSCGLSLVNSCEPIKKRIMAHAAG